MAGADWLSKVLGLPEQPGVPESARPDPRTCIHPDVASAVDVVRVDLTDEADLVPVRYEAYVRVWCRACGDRFRWLGVPGGVGACPFEPTVDEGALELRAPMAATSTLTSDVQLRCPVDHGARS